MCQLEKIPEYLYKKYNTDKVPSVGYLLPIYTQHIRHRRRTSLVCTTGVLCDASFLHDVNITRRQRSAVADHVLVKSLSKAFIQQSNLCSPKMVG